jgi:putative methionine-R-sulfoxide reductase with GAF domain
MDTLDDHRWLKRPWEEKNGSRSAVSVPFMNSDKVLGVLTLAHPSAKWFTRNDLAILASIALYTTMLALIPYEEETSS